MKRDFKKVLGLAGLFTSLYAGMVNLYPSIHSTNVDGILIAVAAGVSAYANTAKTSPKNPKLPA